MHLQFSDANVKRVFRATNINLERPKRRAFHTRAHPSLSGMDSPRDACASNVRNHVRAREKERERERERNAK